MKTDFHLHSSFSGDSTASLPSMIEKGIDLGLTTMCFTDHQDFDYPNDEIIFTFQTDVYFQELLKWQEYYKNKINILIGVELGLQPHLADRLDKYVNQYPFDFIIGSSHLANGVDPYYPEYFLGRKEEEAYLEYFTSIADNIRHFSSFQVYGHIDYVIRYGPNKAKYYSYSKYADVIDEILKLLIEKNLGIELNTAGLKYGLGQPHPHPDIIKRYKELGGEIITVGSDAHKPEHIAYDFSAAKSILKDCGFRYYTLFKNRTPEFIKL